ncbi:MAG: dihydroorotate dehydrogenase [Desulfarculales bacterium]|jgi:dihydroorotate dehydrogenase (NAD+) catalytic subunit|nr:dihydroorotate dehydrogenase [Desulfarculales bacterium]
MSVKPDLTCRIGNLVARNPIFAASGTYGFGEELADYANIGKLGGLVTKGLSLSPRPGNRPPRICETMSGMLNSIGLANPGLDIFIRDKLPYLQKIADAGCLVIVNMYAENRQEFVDLSKALSAVSGISALELNLSCPNVSDGGMAFGVDPGAVFRITQAVRENTNLPLWVKLTPNVTNIVEIAQAALQGGADAISMINTLLATAIDARARKFRLGNIMGGLSGPAIKPVALRMVLQVSKELDIPIVGMGGITGGSDIIEFFLAGACAVQIGSANLMDPLAMERINAELFDFCLEENVSKLQDLSGQLAAECRLQKI